MTERFKVLVLKTSEGASPPWVRIPLHPPINEEYMNKFYLTDFLSRSTDIAIDDTPLFKVLKELPELGWDRSFFMNKDGPGPWLAGGALRRTLQGFKLDSDFDFFFHSAEQLEEFSTLLQAKNKNLHKSKETEHHVEFKGVVGEDNLEVKVQLIRFAYYNSPEEVIDSFDFTICQFAYDGLELIYGDYALWDLGRKRLAVNKITYPLSTMRRVLKYTKQGFNACSGCLSAILRAIPENPELMQQMGIHYVD